MRRRARGAQFHVPRIETHLVGNAVTMEALTTLVPSFLRPATYNLV
jgi:hypothetical protein